MLKVSFALPSISDQVSLKLKKSNKRFKPSSLKSVSNRRNVTSPNPCLMTFVLFLFFELM